MVAGVTIFMQNMRPSIHNSFVVSNEIKNHFLHWRHDIQHNDTQLNDTQHNGLICDTQDDSLVCRYAECLYAECRFAEFVMQSVLAPLNPLSFGSE
jgi:hypothetical protein